VLGFKPSALTSIVYQILPANKYTTFTIPKKSGGTRIIKAPIPKLKKLQKHLSHLLYGCLVEIETGRKASPVSYGFRKKGTIAANAKNHKRRRYVLNLDLVDFFPTFHFGRVRGFFLKDKSFELTDEVATTIAQIACDGVALPQGSPCSPVISELIGQILDVRLLKFAKKHGVRYSRYADDITFSTNQKDFPPALAVQDPNDQSVWTLGDELIKKIGNAGFNINIKKTRMNLRGSRQTVTGLVVNEKINIKSEYYRKSRAMCDALFQTGEYYRSFLPPKNLGDEPSPELTNSLSPLEGILNHIYTVTQTEECRPVQEQRKYPRAIRTLFRRFLFYKYCIALKVPLIITEGKTDPVYLREAIKRRPQFHPLLGQPGKGGFNFVAQFFRYDGQSSEIMDLGGGTSELKSIPLDYLRNIDSSKSSRKPFKHKPMLCPVILVLDNDDGLSGVASTIKKNFGITITIGSTAAFYHIMENLYLIKTPEAHGKSCIEDMFPKQWLGQQLNGKKFSSKSKIDPNKEYGKEIFAKRIVIPNANNIDFSGFDELLERIVKVLDDYKPKPDTPSTP